ncbi:hypothetical protein L3Q82_005937 [Scortum barcoo]|uniref:Uncharacterized protein n=1 Tax=Scortum barcoo TaxID=214431 RepID=A0ACB8X2M2_9TELE|nr:hypothetical protein L3Q82_005937 [Scortum barcoo]
MNNTHFAALGSMNSIKPESTEEHVAEGRNINLTCNTLEDGITANSAEVFSSEGRSVTLSCNYSVKADNLQWYQQDPGSAPQFLLLITDAKEPSVVEAKPPHPRLTAKLNEERNQVYLQISSAAVTDSAVYYCAVKAHSDRKQQNSVQKPLEQRQQNNSTTSTRGSHALLNFNANKINRPLGPAV